MLSIFFCIFNYFLINKVIKSKLEIGYTKIDFIYVGQGNATYIKIAKGKNILIDGGEGRSEKYEEGLKTFLPYLLKKGVRKIDEAYITHLDSDHFGGIYYAIKYLNVNTVYLPFGSEKYVEFKDIQKICSERNTKLKIIGSGWNKKIEDEIFVYSLWPEKELKENKTNINKDKKIKRKTNERNNNSLVLKLNICNTNILFTGDIEKEAEESLVKKYKNALESDILMVPHHGSKTSSTYSFLKKVKPKFSVISCGKDNLFKHPNDEVLKRYEKINSKIYRTDEKGLISFKIFKNKKVKIKTFK